MPNENESKRDATSQPAWPAVQSSATKEIGVPALHRSWASVKESRINPPGGLLPPPSPGQNTYKGTQALNPRGRAAGVHIALSAGTKALDPRLRACCQGAHIF